MSSRADIFREGLKRDVIDLADATSLPEQRANMGIIRALAAMTKARVAPVCHDWPPHIEMMDEVCHIFAQASGLPPFAQYLFRALGLAHDLGKGAFLDIIGKSPHSDEERLRYRGHVGESLKLLGELQGESGDLLRAVIGDHHERPLGQGYPAGKRGDELSRMTVSFINLDVFTTIVWPPAETLPRAFMHPHERLKIAMSELHKGALDGEFGKGACALFFDVLEGGAFDHLQITFQGQTFLLGHLRHGEMRAGAEEVTGEECEMRR